MDRLHSVLRLQHGERFLGIDCSPFALEQARAGFAQRAPGAEAEFLESEIGEYRPASGSFDAIAWIGGPYIGG